MQVRMADLDDLQQIMKVYHSLVGSYGCTWSYEYPTEVEVKADIDKTALYVVEADGEIIAVAACGDINPLNDLECWSNNIKKPADLARIGVVLPYQNRGIATKLIEYIEKDIISKGFDGIHFLVSKTNPKAIAVYDKLGYKSCGECFAYDVDWFCYEKKIN